MTSSGRAGFVSVGLATGMAALVAVLLAGCQVDPFCVTCGDGAVPPDGSGEAGPGDGEVPEDGAVDGSMVPDAAVDAGCTVETCNGIDDDCDGLVDEDFDTMSDPRHCGGCDMECVVPHAFATCDEGMCGIGMCDVEFYDLNMDPADGCEYRCHHTADDDSICDLRDNDCDGLRDEDVDLASDPVNCGVCGRVCRLAHAVAGCEPDHCDGTDPPVACSSDADCSGGARCLGACALASCDEGFYDVDGRADNGCEYACTPAVPPTEVCNRRDDDCDGEVDNPPAGGSLPGVGVSCGTDTGECVAGTTICRAGAITCDMAVDPTTELCNGLDDDCDGMVDEGDPEGGDLCGSSVGTCELGRQRCVDGSLTCVGGVGPVDELCDGLDNNCDGTIDDGNPEGGAPCGETRGECTAGAMTCRGGTLVCEGGTGPSPEACDGLDNDCDGMTDEDFDLTSDPMNCGACGTVCGEPHAVTRCNMSACEVIGCEEGYHDLDPTVPGCEYRCDILGFEVCNGVDDDCDGEIDEMLTPPMSFCNPNGVCAGTTAECTGAGGWVCMYPATYEVTETRCDGLDNDCDGMTDEDYPLKDTDCFNGIGACRSSGTFVCNATEDGLTCTAPPAGTPADEECDNLDNDCDGMVDERTPDDPGTPWRDGITVDAISTVVVDRASGGTMRIMQYEASRPDATSTEPGSVNDFACSRPDVVPWTSVSRPAARAACCALNPSGTCPGAGVGWRLCTAPDWQSACEGPAGTCDWSYATMCSTSQPTRCNGKEYDCLSLPGDQDCLFTTGSPDFPGCRTSWGAAGSVYDMSGNVREWTNTAVSAGRYEARGGSYTSIEAGRRCDFDFTVMPQGLELPNTGFRCCYY